MKLPEKFEERMQDMLGEAYPAFRASYEREKNQALRVNPYKVDRESFLLSVSFPLEKVLWEENGFYYDSSLQPGKHPWHDAGLYYIQEPSAMAPASYLEAQPGEKILDLCAAPGGKTTQIATQMQQKGLLVCNEINSARAKILSENVERMGIKNALVTNETPAKLSEVFPQFFDRILVDAPCSGEGMFRKNEQACREWSLENVQLCADRQDEILDCAANMLRAGGRLVYSTCTFAPDENEGSISRFLQRHQEFHILDTTLYEGMDRGRVEWTIPPCNREDITRTIRLWPHSVKGEGHFLAVLQKGDVDGINGSPKYGYEKTVTKKELEKLSVFFTFQQENLKKNLLEEENAGLLTFGEQLYLMPKDMPALYGLKVLRPGLHLGAVKKGRFEPSHALALYVKPDEVRRVMPLEAEDGQTKDYLQGQTLACEGEKGWYLITVDGYSLGWGKLAGQIMKNHYPKGLRKLY